MKIPLKNKVMMVLEDQNQCLSSSFRMLSFSYPEEFGEEQTTGRC